MNKKFIVMAAFAAVFGMSFTACSNEDESVATGNNIPATRAISFNSYMDGVGATRAYNASVADIQADGISVWAFDATKETAINNEGGTYFMGGYNAGLEHTYGRTGYATVWKAAADYFWPEYNLNFVALTPQSGEGGIGTITCSQAAATGEPAVPSKPVMTVAVNVPLTTEDAGTYGEDSQKDIMFASLEDQGALAEFAPAPLSFKHGLSQLVFKGVIDHETTITKAVVKSIKLVNVAASGTLTYTAADDAIVASGWGDKDQTYAANIVNDEVTTLDNSGSADAISGQDDNASGRDYQMMIMPQASVLCVGATTENLSQLSAPTAGTYLLVNATLYANNNDTDAVLENTTNVYIPLAVTTWAPNTKYTYTLKFGDNLLHPITFTASISDWATDSKNVEF
jgi:hypothetical protein